MKHLHLEKKGLRGLAIAESFLQTSKNSVLAGIIMRRDFIIDGFVLGKTTLEGDDATDEIFKMYNKLERLDINLQVSIVARPLTTKYLVLHFQPLPHILHQHQIFSIVKLNQVILQQLMKNHLHQ